MFFTKEACVIKSSFSFGELTFVDGKSTFFSYGTEFGFDPSTFFLLRNVMNYFCCLSLSSSQTFHTLSPFSSPF